MVYPLRERAWILVACPPEFASYANQMSPAMCRSRTKTCPRRAAAIPGAGEARGKRSQLAARLSSGTMRPNTRIAAPHPQNDRGQPAGRPPTIAVPAMSELTADILKLRTASGFRPRADLLDLCMCTNDVEKSQGIVTLHSGGGGRKGRASEETEIVKAKIDAVITRLNMQGLPINGPAPAKRTPRILSNLSLRFKVSHLNKLNN
jgi:hypothetical protein